MCPELGSEDRHLYATILEEVAGRVEAVRGLLAPDAPIPNVELGALHLRKVLELIVMGSLVTNRTEIESIAKALQRKKAREARELAKAANPHYWPKGTMPFFGTPHTGAIEVKPAPGALSEDEWDSVYGHLGGLLHARNPFKKPIDLAAERVWLEQLRNKIMSLLEHHIVTLVDRDYMLIGLMKTDQGTVQVVMLARDSPNTAHMVL